MPAVRTWASSSPACWSAPWSRIHSRRTSTGGRGTGLWRSTGNRRTQLTTSHASRARLSRATRWPSVLCGKLAAANEVRCSERVFCPTTHRRRTIAVSKSHRGTGRRANLLGRLAGGHYPEEEIHAYQNRGGVRSKENGACAGRPAQASGTIGPLYARGARGAEGSGALHMARGTEGAYPRPLQGNPGSARQEGLSARRGHGRLESGFGRCAAPVSAGSKPASQRQAGLSFDRRVGPGPQVLSGSRLAARRRAIGLVRKTYPA